MAQLHPLQDGQIDRFIRDGFVRIEKAFSSDLAAAARDVLWRDTGCNPNDPSTWTQPVVRLGFYGDKPFVEAANTPILHAAFDQLVGRKRWLPRMNLGTFPVRFPSVIEPDDTGWHIDVSVGDDGDDFFSWRANVCSKGRALLLLFLFSDVGENDAPTRLRVGSHKDIARRLAPSGAAGMSLRELATNGFAESASRPIASAEGKAGTVFLCHPFLVHAAQKHRGKRPRFMAQPPLHPAMPLSLHRLDSDYSPVEIAIREALA